MVNGLPKGLSPTYWKTWSPPRDGQSIGQSLEEGEEWIGSWDGVGLYEGNNKIPAYENVSVNLTTHRLILIPDPYTPTTSTAKPASSLQTHLSYVRQTEFYTGFMRSSAKITLFIGRSLTSNGSVQGEVAEARADWTCGVCGFVNPSSSDTIPSAAKCGLCGVTYSKTRSQHTNPHNPADTPIAPPESAVDPEGRIPCPACTFLNHRYLSSCEICSTPLPGANGQCAPAPVQATLNGTGDDAQLDVARLSFRKGGEKEAYRKLKTVLGAKDWDRPQRGTRGHRPNPSTSSDGVENGDETPRARGIDGIMQTISLDAKVQDDNMQDAFRDLEQLMVRAGEMVRLAQSLNQKLNTQQTSTSPNPTEEETTLIRASLVQLGLPSPALTQDMVKDDQNYHEGLAKELGGLLVGNAGDGLMVGKGGRGVIGLDEVWGLWMRARGVSLLPPSTLISILPFLPQHTSPPIRSLTLPSSLMVLYSPQYAPQNILARTIQLLTPDPHPEVVVEPSLNLIEFSAYEGLPIGLAKELMEQIQGLGGVPGAGEGIVRDDQAGQGDGGVRWYRDLISSWPVEDLVSE